MNTLHEGDVLVWGRSALQKGAPHFFVTCDINTITDAVAKGSMSK